MVQSPQELADFLPEKDREGTGVSAALGTKLCLFGFWKNPLICRDGQGVSKCVMIFPAPSTNQPPVWKFLAWLISSQFNGLWGESFHVIVKSHLSLPPSQDGNKETGSAGGLVPMTSVSCDGNPPDCIVWAFLPLQPRSVPPQAKERETLLGARFSSQIISKTKKEKKRSCRILPFPADSSK